jgi:hypothetical protein
MNYMSNFRSHDALYFRTEEVGMPNTKILD